MNRGKTKPHEIRHHDNLWKHENYILFCGEARRQDNGTSPSKPILNEEKSTDHSSFTLASRQAAYDRTAAVR